MSSPSIDIQVWSDVACPWCYVGKRRLEAALRDFEHRDSVKLTWRSFELDPSAPALRPSDGPYALRLSKKYGMSLPQAEARIQQLVELAAAEGLELRFDRLRPGNTFDAHRLLHLAASRGVQDAAKERLLRAYFTEGEPIGDRRVLGRLGFDVGLDADEIGAMLAGDGYADAVRADENQAQRLGIRGVPFFVLAGRHALSGAQPVDLFHEALHQAWTEIETARGTEAVCGADGCT